MTSRASEPKSLILWTITMALLGVDPQLDRLRANPRFQQLVAKVDGGRR